ncbi:MAG: CinA family protein [Lautropia sp.]|nr:CinA family protein [Lautropia sp.]
MPDESSIASIVPWAEQLGERVRRLGFGLICTAESCTGGLIAAALTETPGSSAWFGRGYVTYANRAKVDMLGVSPADLQIHGAVSEVVARQMALGALADEDGFLSLAVTGIAGPGGGQIGKPVGTVCFGWALRWPMQPGAPLVSSETRHFQGERRAIRHQTAAYALARALQVLDRQNADRPLIG